MADKSWENREKGVKIFQIFFLDTKLLFQQGTQRKFYLMGKGISAKSPLKPNSGAVPILQETEETTDVHLSGCPWAFPADGSISLLIPLYHTTLWSLQTGKPITFPAENQSNDPGMIGLQEISLPKQLPGRNSTFSAMPEIILGLSESTRSRTKQRSELIIFSFQAAFVIHSVTLTRHLNSLLQRGAEEVTM